MEGARHATDDEAIQEEVLRRTTGLLSSADFSRPTPLYIGAVHRFVRELTGIPDPYRSAKDQFNASIMKIYPLLKKLIEQSDDPVDTALRLASGGNAIDMIMDADLQEVNVADAVQQFLSDPVPGPFLDEFKTSVQKAEDILYLGDNAGEIVLDRLLIELLSSEKITYVVKGGPVINDVTLHDAHSCGMTEIVEVIDNGTDLPGTVLDQCSESFQDRFLSADLIISKGQGNYESVSDLNKEVFFIFKAKCSVIEEHLDCEPGAPVFIHQVADPELISR